jgi:hypothetical protein
MELEGGLSTSTIPGKYGYEMVTEDFTAHGITVPAGFVFDGASTPRIFWSIVPPFKATKEASCIHDWLCRQAKNKEERLFADRLFFQMLREYGDLSFIRAALGYVGVRLGAHFGVGVRYPHWTNLWKGK